MSKVEASSNQNMIVKKPSLRGISSTANQKKQINQSRNQNRSLSKEKIINKTYTVPKLKSKHL